MFCNKNSEKYVNNMSNNGSRNSENSNNYKYYGGNSENSGHYNRQDTCCICQCACYPEPIYNCCFFPVNQNCTYSDYAQQGTNGTIV